MNTHQATPPLKNPPRNSAVLRLPWPPAREISVPPTAANQRMAVGDETARNTPRENSLKPERLATSPAIARPLWLLIADITIFSAKPINKRDPPSHSAQRTHSYCSSTVMPASARTAYNRSPKQVPRPSQKP